MLNASAECTHVVGPDTPPVYDPQTDNHGCFIAECCKGCSILFLTPANNNCYNYGNDIVTNTFAQPGRGTGHKWVSDNCSSVTAGAKSDGEQNHILHHDSSLGLVWAGTTLPTKQPAHGHYVAMLIWPQTNFHWIRMDAVGSRQCSLTCRIHTGRTSPEARPPATSMTMATPSVIPPRQTLRHGPSFAGNCYLLYWNPLPCFTITCSSLACFILTHRYFVTVPSQVTIN